MSDSPGWGSKPWPPLETLRSPLSESHTEFGSLAQEMFRKKKKILENYEFNFIVNQHTFTGLIEIIPCG